MISPPSGPRKIVLVVEDEPLLRMMAVDIIEEAGFEALEAGNAIEAVAILERRTDIRLVYTDIDMPGGLNGMKLAAMVRDRWPPIELIITSGNHAMKDVDLPTRGVFMPKPVRPADLTAMLHRMAA
jgi:CheY-like chemotaxis protein